MFESLLHRKLTALLCPNGKLCVTVASAANDDDPVNTGFAWGDEVLEGSFGGDGEDLLGGLETDDAFEGRDCVLAVGRDEFRDLVSWHALFLKGRVGQLFADVVGHLNDHPHRIRHAGFLHPFHHIRRVVVQQMSTELFGLFRKPRSPVHTSKCEEGVFNALCLF